MRKFLAVGMSSSRVMEVSSLQARVLADCCWDMEVSSLLLLEGKKWDNGLFLGVLGGESDYEISCQLELFEVEMVVVHESTMPVDKIDLLLYLVLGKEEAWPLKLRGLSTKRVYTS